jgi:flagellar protein FlaG
MDIIINSASPPIVTAIMPSLSGSSTDNPELTMTNTASSAPVLTAVVSSFSPAAANIKQAVTELNDHVQTLQRDLHFSVDQGMMVVKVVDTESNKVISQMPTQAALDLAQTLNADNNATSFNLFNSKA